MTASHADVGPLPFLKAGCCRFVDLLAHEFILCGRVLNYASRVTMQRVDWWLARLELLFAAVRLRTTEIRPLLHHLLLLMRCSHRCAAILILRWRERWHDQATFFVWLYHEIIFVVHGCTALVLYSLAHRHVVHGLSIGVEARSRIHTCHRETVGKVVRGLAAVSWHRLGAKIR